MKPLKFVHAADLHLDSPFVGLEGLPDPVRRRVRESTFRALDRLADIVIGERADALLIAGDVYDAADRSLRAQLRFQRMLERLAERGIPVFVTHGNHDPLDGARLALDVPPGVHIYAGSGPETVALECPRRGTLALVHGQSFATRVVTDNLASAFVRSPSSGDRYQIGLLHANVEGQAEHDNYAPCSLRDLAASGLDYWALGHIHDRRIWSEAPWVVYPGNLQGRSVREMGAKGCYIADVSEAGRTSLRFAAADYVRWFEQQIDLTAVGTVRELRAAIETSLEETRRLADGRAGFVRLKLTGRSPLYRELAGGGALLEELLAEWREREQLRAADEESPFVWPCGASIVSAGLPLDMEALRGQEGLLGELIAAAETLTADPAALTAWAREVLAPLSGGKAALWWSYGERDLAAWLQEAQELAVAAAMEQMEREADEDAG